MKKIEELAQKMKSPQERGILSDCLFGEADLKEGRLYIQRDIAPQNIVLDIMTEVGPQGASDIDLMLEKAAQLAGLKPLRTRAVCLDLFDALGNVGLGKGLTYEILSEKSFGKGKESIGERIVYGRKHGASGIMNLFTGELTSAIKINDKELFFMGFLDDLICSEELILSARVKELQGVPTGDILAAYKINLSAASRTRTDYLDAYKANAKAKFQEQIAKFQHK